MSGTASVPGWWVEFQTSVLRQLPRPGDIDQATAEGWCKNQGVLREVLAEALVPSGIIEPKPTHWILKFVSGVWVNATTGKFVAKEKFVCDTGPNAAVKISHLGGNFTSWFLSGDGKTEDPITEQKLRCHKLLKPSVDGPIIAELGGEVKAETTLLEMYCVMMKQKHGENGALLKNKYVNIFYIKDSTGVLRAVCVDWRDGGWNVLASSVEGLDKWRVGCQVFSRVTSAN